jgi:hypothetical protein
MMPAEPSFNELMAAAELAPLVETALTPGIYGEMLGKPKDVLEAVQRAIGAATALFDGDVKREQRIVAELMAFLSRAVAFGTRSPLDLDLRANLAEHAVEVSSGGVVALKFQDTVEIREFCSKLLGAAERLESRDTDYGAFVEEVFNGDRPE